MNLRSLARPFQIGFLASVSVILCTQTTSASPGTVATPLANALEYIDGDAGIVGSLSLRQLQNLYSFAHRALPKDRATIELATFGATAILGWNPTRTKAWTARGFDVDAPVLVQLAAPAFNDSQAKTPSLNLWRTRIILKSSNAAKAINAIQSIRFRHKTPISARSGKTDIKVLSSELNIDNPQDKRLLPRLQKAGVLLVASPTPLDGILVASAQKDTIIIDLLVPRRNTIDWGNTQHQDLLVHAIQRQPKLLDPQMPGAKSLRPGRIGAWIRPVHAAAMLRFGNSGKTQSLACSQVSQLVKNSPFHAFSAELELNYKRSSSKKRNEFFRGALHWHLKSGAPLQSMLTASPRALVRPNGAIFELDIILDSMARFKQPGANTNAWLPLWRATQNCGFGSKLLVSSTSWPDILSALLHEVAALHPDSAQFLEGLGGSLLSIHPPAKNSQPASIVAQAWVRSPGDAVAKGWLSVLFGRPQNNGNITQWGKAPIEPFAISQSGGSIIGAGFSPGSRRFALGQKLSPGGAELLRVTARPQELLRALPQKSPTLGPLANLWQNLEATLTLDKGTLELRFRAE